MKAFSLVTAVFFAIGALAAHAEDTATQADSLLQRVEEDFRAAFPDLADELRFEYPQHYPSTLVVDYRTRKFTVYGRSMTGEVSEQPHEAVGPTHVGFRLQISVQDDSVVNQAMMPQSLREPYWVTDLSERHPAGTGKQLFCRLSRGGRLDQDVLGRLTTFQINLGEGEHDRLQPAPSEPAGAGPRRSAPRGQLGAPLGYPLTIEGVLVTGGKVESNTLLVDNVNGQRLAEPVSVVVSCSYVEDHNLRRGRIALPAKTRCVLRGYEEFTMIGVPPAVHQLADQLGWEERPLSPTPWQWRTTFVALDVVAPAGLEIERPTD
ncbi:hypothetical protein KOR34_46160 [Posidoniimonas corsicana]|uniref:Uncharacterized protein n=1 Tax=Posidoniimonas corsicana TaxID=1938618 RepID=A0A5C5V035_9BACT|nr:hypothetical protein [Posidoniimonas corsicana]TWT31240.1 hypothetical protein KOR34_46160 [Posidoniimonas corsicana]